MDAVAGQPAEQFARAQARWLAAASPLAPLARGATLQQTLGRVAQRQAAQAASAATALPALAFDPQALRQAAELATAIGAQWMALQWQWIEGAASLAQEAGEMRDANTVAKYVDQEMNLVQQALALATTHLTASARLAENVQNNLAWWLSQRTGSDA